uniref:Uncharacterized protein n=1 Tax=Meloidogyne enterolobii TaxID=390850 RepID=A0A6V7W3V9_MELEN|nr:unnamed protein product [Meloidogyne enterolobii]
MTTMEIDQILGNDTIIGEGGDGGSGQKTTTSSTNNKKKNNNLFESIQKENEQIKEAIRKTHDFIREAIVDQSKEVVKEILQQVNPRFLEIENSILELKNAVQGLSAESETSSDSVSVMGPEEEEVEGEPIINEEQQQNAQQRENQQNNRIDARDGPQNRREARGRGNGRDREAAAVPEMLDCFSSYAN